MSRNRRDLQTDTHRIDGVQVNPQDPEGKVQTAVVIENDNDNPVIVNGGFVTNTGTIDSLLDTVTLQSAGCSTASIKLDGSFTGLVQVQGSIDGVSYGPIDVYDTISGTVQAFISTNGVHLAQIGGFRDIRIQATSWTSGSVTATVTCTGGTNITGAHIIAPFGQTTSAASFPVVLPSDQDPIGTQPSGLQNGGRYSTVTITDAAWTALPAAALVDRNQINVQNFSGFEIKINHTGTGGYDDNGMRILDRSERFYQITDDIVIYARAESGAGSIDIDVEEIS